MTYEYHVFVSYPHAGHVGAWTRNHLAPTLRECLADEIRRPQVFVDEAIEPGARWREELRRSLGRSRLLLAIWSPLYFDSDYCMAEWGTMAARERVLDVGGAHRPSTRLVFPIRYSDGESFPDAAKEIEQDEIFKDFRYPYPQFRDSQKYLPFHDAVVDLAQRITTRLPNVPPWDPDWPTAFPDLPPDPGPSSLPRL
jgi:hypothetical protein